MKTMKYLTLLALLLVFTINSGSLYAQEEASPKEKDNVSFTFIQKSPIYPGCEEVETAKQKKCFSSKISEFIGNNFNMDMVDKLKIGDERVRIMARFTISTDGTVTNIKARSKYKELEEEAKRVLALLPKMTPGEQRNRPVNVVFALPIIFNIDHSSDKK